MTISPGWYKDPAEPTTQRYWDGEGWVGGALPVDATPPEGPLPEPATPSTPPTATADLSAGSATAASPDSAPAADPIPADSLTPSASPSTAPSPLPGQPPVRGRAGDPRLLVPLIPVRPHGLPLASPGARFVARFIDIIMVLLLNAIVNGWFIYKFLQESIPYTQEMLRAFSSGRSLEEVTRPAQMDSLLMVISLLAMALWLAYEVPSTAQSGQTLGKRAAKIKIVRAESQEPLGFLRALRRWNPMGLPVLMLWCCGPFFVVFQIFDVIFVALDRVQRMALHDRSAATYVVQLPGSPRRKGK